MTADAVLARELAALKDELSVSPRQRRSPPADREQAAENTVQPPPADATGEERQAAEQLGDFVDSIREFVEEAEHNVSAHPVASIAGALLLGIVIGRLLGKR